MSQIKNSIIAKLIKSEYSLSDIRKIADLLRQSNSLDFSPLDNGLFAAAEIQDSNDYTGYQAVWVRDNIHVANALLVSNTPENIEAAVRVVRALSIHFQKEKTSLESIINEGFAPDSPMLRPHIRFDGSSITRIDQEWNHAQNDALAYFLWFYCQLVEKELLPSKLSDDSVLSLFPLYFDAINFCKDEDSGHWEESPKVEASSIGTVVAALKAMRQLIQDNHEFSSSLRPYNGRTVTISLLNNLIQKGESALAQILPFECVQDNRWRKYDAALLFLIYPLHCLEQSEADQILKNIQENLQGEHGISRYKGDSFWCRNYQGMPQEIRTSISSEREAWLKVNGGPLRDGEEAQWCIFDPIISAIYGERYQKSGLKQDLEQQIHYFNRSLGQLSSEDFHLGGLKCPELYYLQDDRYIPNDTTPLRWTQANLLIALTLVRQSLSVANSSGNNIVSPV